MAGNEQNDWKPVRVLQRTEQATGIISLDLQALDGSDLPAFSAGAHIDVRLPCGLVRQYSLCKSAKTDAVRWWWRGYGAGSSCFTRISRYHKNACHLHAERAGRS